MKQQFRRIGSAILSVSLVGALALAQDDAADDSVAADPTVNVQGLEIAGGTIASYLESRSASNPSEGGLCFNQPNENVAPEAGSVDDGTTADGTTDDGTTDGTTDDTTATTDAGESTTDDGSATEAVQVADGDASYTCLVQALTATGLLETLGAEGSYTLFAPTDDAFASLADSMTESEFEALLTDTAQLTEILNYHVATEARTLSDLSTEAASAPITLTTAQGSDLTITFENDASESSDTTQIDEDEVVVRVGSSAASTANVEGDAFVTQEAVQTDNGIVIAIDQVLMLPEEEAAQ